MRIPKNHGPLKTPRSTPITNPKTRNVPVREEFGVILCICAAVTIETFDRHQSKCNGLKRSLLLSKRKLKFRDLKYAVFFQRALSVFDFRQAHN